MNTIKAAPLVAATLCFANILTASFSVDFTSTEGYVEGETLFANTAWSAPDSDVFTVSDVAGAGVLTVGNANFAKATYTGNAGALSTNDYVSATVFTLDYSGDSSANVQPATPLLLGRYEFGGGDLTGAALRQTSAGPGEYNVNLFHNLTGSADNLYEGFITAAQLGLATDGATWTDPVSDPLELVHSLAYDGTEWTQSVTVTNLTTSEVLATLSRTFADAGTFKGTTNSFIINTGTTHLAPGLLIKVDSVSVTAAEPPPPSAISVDFTAAEGYSDGTLNTNGGGVWTVPNPVVWNVIDSAGDGLLAIDPNGNFQRITYAGPGSALTSNAYRSANVIILDYSADTAGANLSPSGNTLLARFEFQGGGVTGSWLRQLGDAENSLPGQFSLYVYNDLNSLKPQGGGITLESADVGLAHDGSNWTDAVSDPLQLDHYMVYDAGSGEWTQAAVLTNLATGTVLDTLVQTFAEDDGSFLASTNSYVINNGRLNDLANLTFTIDSIDISIDAVAPLPTKWAGFPIAEDGVSVETGAFMGWLDIVTEPWVYSYSLDNYIYLFEDNVGGIGAWVYIPRSNASADTPETWAGYPIGTDGVTVDTGGFLGWISISNDPWIWSYSLGKYIHLPEGSVTDSGAWAYVLQ